MKRIVINISTLILQGIAFLLLFIPGMFYWEHWEEESWAVSTLELRMDISFFHATRNISEFFGILIVILMLLSIVWVVLDIFIPERISGLIKSDGIIKGLNIALPSIVALFMIVFMLKANKRDDYGYVAPPNVLFYIEVFVLLLIVFLAVLKCTRKFYEIEIKEVPRKINQEPTNTHSLNIDKLKEYKDMLDQGLINEDDYEKYKVKVLEQSVNNEWKMDSPETDELPDL